MIKKALSVAAITSIQFSGGVCLAQAAREIDIAGIKIGSSVDDALSALKAIDKVKIRENTGTFTLRNYTSPTLNYGVNATLGDNPFNTVDILYDQHKPQAAIAISRAQVFGEGAMPTVDYVHNTLLEKSISSEKRSITA